MIIDKKHKGSEVSIQGTLHAVVPVNGEGSTTQAVHRLERAMKEIGEKYGITLNMMYDYPLDAPPPAQKEWIDKAIDRSAKLNRRYISEHKQGHSTRNPPVTRFEDDVALPKCDYGEEYKSFAKREINRPARGIWEDYAGNWLQMAKFEDKRGRHFYYASCPFCSHGIKEIEVTPSTNAVASMKQRLMDFPTSCNRCDICFTWDFKENIVTMTKVKS